MLSENKRKILIMFYVSIASLVMLVAASFAWMSISTTPIVSDLSLYIVTENALNVAPDKDGVPGEWNSILDLSDLLEEGSAVLRPITFSANDYSIIAPQYGFDGRIDLSSPIRLVDLKTRTSLLSKAEAADELDLSRYLLIYDFWMGTDSSDCVVSLSPAKETDSETLGSGTFLIGEPVWNAEEVIHEDGGKNAQFAIRLGFLVYPYEDEKIDPEDPYAGRKFVIWEPNADGGKGLQESYSTDPVYFPDEDDEENKLLTDGYKLIRQKTSDWSETDPVLKDTVIYSPGEFMTKNLSLFKLTHGKERHIALFLWLEGTDADCTNAVSAGKLLANIQFTATQDPSDYPIIPD